MNATAHPPDEPDDLILLHLAEFRQNDLEPVGGLPLQLHTDFKTALRHLRLVSTLIPHTLIVGDHLPHERQEALPSLQHLINGWHLQLRFAELSIMPEFNHALCFQQLGQVIEMVDLILCQCCICHLSSSITRNPIVPICGRTKRSASSPYLIYTGSQVYSAPSASLW